ncbi:helix-turn-helix domain-containing protein [Lactobacillus delbrueckii subsp. lactis]|nr:helix-turn-helix domain-containing protein [Lactobacillus delbrueckii subsp. lactis]
MTNRPEASMNVLEINKEALRSLVEPLVEQIARDKAPNIVAQRYVNTKDAAKYLGVSFPTFKKWVEEKNVYPVVIAGAKRWDKQDLDNELEREKRK